MTHLKLIVGVLFVCLAGCSTHNAQNAKEPKALGSDRDAHGCIGSAGYSWCARTKQCERPWELAEGKGFDNSLTGFKEYCES